MLEKQRSMRPLYGDDALPTLFYLALASISKKWSMPLRDFKAALTTFTIQFK
jgi:putative transposase